MSSPTLFTCIGGAVIDRKYRADAPTRRGTSNPGRGSVAFGGVARNVAEGLARLGSRVALRSVIGDDEAGRALAAHLAGLGVDVSGLRTAAGRRTAEYAAILDPDGALALAVADMGVLDGLYEVIAQAPLPTQGWLFADCNAPAAALDALRARARRAGLPLALDAISVPKSARLPGDLSGVACLFLNRDEAAAVLGADAPPAELACALLARGCGRVVLTLGADGLLACDAGGQTHVPAAPAAIRDVTGAGDAVIAGALHGLGRGWAFADSARFGALLASRTLAVAESVDPALSPALAEAFAAGLSSQTERSPA